MLRTPHHCWPRPPCCCLLCTAGSHACCLVGPSICDPGWLHWPCLCPQVGHAGTLDPMATGLLVVATGAGTKFCDDFMALAKEYSGGSSGS